MTERCSVTTMKRGFSLIDAEGAECGDSTPPQSGVPIRCEGFFRPYGRFRMTGLTCRMIHRLLRLFFESRREAEEKRKTRRTAKAEAKSRRRISRETDRFPIEAFGKDKWGASAGMTKLLLVCVKVQAELTK